MSENLQELSLDELRQKWAKAWGYEPHVAIGRKMLEFSLELKLRTLSGDGLNDAQKRRLEALVSEYKRGYNCFEKGREKIKPGVKLVRNWKGNKHIVTVVDGGFEYKNEVFSSLSKIAYNITGTRWNGWLFFGIKL